MLTDEDKMKVEDIIQYQCCAVTVIVMLCIMTVLSLIRKCIYNVSVCLKKKSLLILISLIYDSRHICLFMLIITYVVHHFIDVNGHPL